MTALTCFVGSMRFTSHALYNIITFSERFELYTHHYALKSTGVQRGSSTRPDRCIPNRVAPQLRRPALIALHFNTSRTTRLMFTFPRRLTNISTNVSGRKLLIYFDTNIVDSLNNRPRTQFANSCIKRSSTSYSPVLRG